MPTVSVRYSVDDVDAAIAFYCEQLGFHEDMHPAPRLLLSAPSGAGGGNQILLEDPSGNPIELFEPTRPEAALWSS
jgi:hypothetical protein